MLLIVVPVALIALIYVIYALRVGNFQNDEEEYLTVARYVAAHFPGAIWLSSLFARGTQRLDPIILALPFALMRGPGAFQLAHVIQCLLFVSTAVPCFLLARRAGLARTASIFAAVLCIVVPWAVVATSYLAECLAYPVYAWVLYATWNTITRPSLRNDVLALLALVVAVFSRTAMLALLPILPLAIVWHEWTLGPARHCMAPPPARCSGVSGQPIGCSAHSSPWACSRSCSTASACSPAEDWRR